MIDVIIHTLLNTAWTKNSNNFIKTQNNYYVLMTAIFVSLKSASLTTVEDMRILAFISCFKDKDNLSTFSLSTMIQLVLTCNSWWFTSDTHNYYSGHCHLDAHSALHT